MQFQTIIIIALVFVVIYLAWRVIRLKRFCSEIEVSLRDYDKATRARITSLCEIIKALCKKTKDPKSHARSIIKAFKSSSLDKNSAEYKYAITTYFGADMAAALDDEQEEEELRKALIK